MLLDEGRLADRGPGQRRPALSAATAIDQNFDNYSVEYVFPDGARLFFYGRAMAGCDDEFASYAHGPKGSAIISDIGAHAGQVPHLQGPEHPDQGRI